MQTLSSYQAFQKSGKSRPSIDCDVTRSSTDLTISIPLIHIIAIVGHPELEHTSVLKLSSNTGSLRSHGIYRNASPRSDSPNYPSYNFEDKFLLYGVEESRSKTSWQSEELVLYDSAVLFPILLLVPQFCLYQLASICKKTMPNSLISLRKLRMVHLKQVDLQKTCPDVSNEFLGTWDNPEVLAVSGSKNSFAPLKELTLSCNS